MEDYNWNTVVEDIGEDVGRIYNDYIIQFSGDNTLYLIKDGLRHTIPDFDTFINMGFDLDEILVFKDHGHLKPCRERDIPMGPSVLPFTLQTSENIFEK